MQNDPDNKVDGAIMGPTWSRQDPGGPHIGHMNVAIWGVPLCSPDVTHIISDRVLPNVYSTLIVSRSECACKKYGHMYFFQTIDIQNRFCEKYFLYMNKYINTCLPVPCVLLKSYLIGKRLCGAR